MTVKLGEQLQNLSEHLLQEIFYLIYATKLKWNSFIFMLKLKQVHVVFII